MSRKKVALFLVDGFEELEAIAPVDILRRSGIEVDTVSITETYNVISSRKITILSDKLIKDINFVDFLIQQINIFLSNYLINDFISKSSGKYFFTIDKAKLSPPFLASGVYNTSIFFSVSTAFTVNKELSPGPVPIP